MTNLKRPRRRAEVILLTAALCALLASCREAPKAPPPSAEQAAPSAAQTVTASRTLFYPQADDMLLAPCPVVMPATGSPQQDMAALIRRYLAGPPGDGQVQPFLEHSALRALFLVGSEAVVDLTGPVRAGGGSATEAARVYGIVQTLAYNFSDVKSVRILVDGQEVDTLLGHLDLSRSLPPEPRLVAGSAGTQGDAE